MKIAIISDTHDNLANLKKAVDWIKKQKIGTIIHCGDIFKPETLKEGLKGYRGKIYIIFSEADASFSKIPEDSFEGLPKSKVFEKSGQIKIGGNPVVEQARYGTRNRQNKAGKSGQSGRAFL